MSLEEILREEGIDPKELDIDLDREELKPEEAREIQEKLIEIEQDRITEDEDLLGPSDVRFYSPDVTPVGDGGEVIGADKVMEQFNQLEEEGFRTPDSLMDPIKLDHTSAQGLYDEISTHFLEFASSEISEKRSGKLELAEAVISDSSLNAGEAVRWFEERDTVRFDEFNSRLFSSTRNLELGKNEKVYEQTIDEYWEGLKEQGLDADELVKRGLLLDIGKTLEGLMPRKDEEFRKELDRYMNVLEKFRPEIYANALEEDSEYMIQPVLGDQKLTVLSDMVGTCMTKFDSDGGERSIEQNIYQEAPRMHQNDPFTIVHAIGKNGELAGYTRSYLMRDDEDESFLAIDTVEVPSLYGMEFEDYKDDLQQSSDLVSAGVLGAMKVGVDLGVDHIAGKDSRIKFGPRSGYSNTSRDITYSKIGDEVPFYSVGEVSMSETVERHLPEHGDTSWETRYTKKVPWFADYCDKMQVRGFNTIPEEETTEAKILMEFI